ncbi:uncharacterized protein K460DRAFT_257808, partial [Cucurbitaria berberidis CBS 394.84]
KDEDIPEDGIPTHLREKDAFRTRMRLVQLRTLLMRCHVVQATVHQLERKPWAQDPMKPPYYYYSKMRHFAYRARRLAEALESPDLQARCEYWAGRSCGGTRDWHAAGQHFALAIKHDMEYDTFPSGKVRIRGLRPNEKEDVHFLLENVTKRHESWVKKTAHAREAARYESERTGRPIEDCIVWDGVESPTWFPDRDRIVHIARREFGKKLRREAKDVNGQENQRPGMSEEHKGTKIYKVELTSRELSEEEWRYIRRGDKQTQKREDRMKK